jgi:signal transduction histidine kinase
MLSFDPATALFISGFMYVFMAGFTWLVLYRQHNATDTLWCGGGVLIGGTLLIAIAGPATSLMLVLAAAMAFGGTILRIQTLRLNLKLQRTHSARQLVLLWLAMTLLYAWIECGLQNHILRAQFLSLALVIMFGFTAVLAWRIGVLDSSQNAKWIAAVYVLMMLSMAFRFYQLLGKTGETFIFSEGHVSILLGFTVLISAVVSHFGYIGLALDRALKREVAAAAQRARDEEIHRLGSQIAQLDRQRSLGEMSASLGHELNQPLTAILTNAEVMKRGVVSGRISSAQQLDLLEKVINNTQRASRIIDRIRGFIRPSSADKVPVDMYRVAVEVTELLADDARRHGVTMRVAMPPRNPLVSGDAIQISQIIVNLCRNAIDVLISVAQREIDLTWNFIDDRVVLRIRDTGPGFPEEALSKIGAPFFTTKMNGLGMGITISRSIAMRHGGTLKFANCANGGAFAELSLPALRESSQ